jgi:hypothetical protein
MVPPIISKTGEEADSREAASVRKDQRDVDLDLL